MNRPLFPSSRNEADVRVNRVKGENEFPDGLISFDIKMVFNSLEFVLFFLIVLSIYTLISGRKWILLLVASYYFYSCWKVEYLPLLLTTTLLNYLFAIWIARSINQRRRRLYLLLSLVGSLGLLFVFKYLNFVGGFVNDIYLLFGVPRVVPILHVALPIGISFYTFQALGYTIDVFSGKVKPENHLGFFSLFIAFFPQLVAGPIERAESLLSQLKRNRPFDYDRFVSGFIIAIWGLFKKVVIADRLAMYVDAVYNNVYDYSGLPLLISTYFFAFQIYCDFSGYSDIAIGCAKMLGYDLRKNFDAPYFSVSLPEFWRRWHISLMSWFRDYLYFPLGGNRKGQIRKQCNQFIVFVVSGLWHGASLTFVFWGVYHACLQIISNLTAPFRERLFKSLKIPPRLVRIVGGFVTFHFVCFGWIFFRANNIKDLAYILRNLARDIVNTSAVLGPFSLRELEVVLLSIGVLLFIEIAQKEKRITNMFEEAPIVVRHSVYCTLIIAILMFGVFREEPFLYFQF